ncbi:MAG: hypothetical protein C4331_19265 [Meiothermus sp.]
MKRWQDNPAVMGWLFLLPSFLGFVVFAAIPVVRGFWISFTERGYGEGFFKVVSVESPKG